MTSPKRKTGPQAALSTTKPRSILLEPPTPFEDTGMVPLPEPSPLATTPPAPRHEGSHRRTRHYHATHRVMKWWHLW